MPETSSYHSAYRCPTLRFLVFKLPAELIVETLSHFGDPHHNMRRERTGRGSGIPLVELVERVTVIRKLTMTCWGLRNILFPLLWEYVEGCNMFAPCPDRPTAEHMISLKNGLPAQCSYLIRNPTIGAYIQYAYSCLSRIKLTRCHFVGPSRWTCHPRTARKTLWILLAV